MRLVALLLCLVTSQLHAATYFSVLSGFTRPAAETRLDRHVFARLDKEGWYPVHVLPQGNQPGYSYSLGFSLYFGQPEVVITGLPPAVAEQFLANLADTFKVDEQPLHLYQRYRDIAEDSPVAFVPVSPRYFDARFDYAAWFYHAYRDYMPVVQMVWSDEQGRLPWQKDYDPAYRAAQPLFDK